MSILLSAYFAEGIVFAADKNITLTSSDHSTDVLHAQATKVLGWPQRTAAIGFCGLGALAELPMDEWMRVFIAGTRRFTDLTDLASRLRDQIQHDFDRDYSSSTDIAEAGLIIHLGGFIPVQGHLVPALYHIHNVPNRATMVATRVFELSEEVATQFATWGAADYPARTRGRLAEMLNDRDHFLWFNNGYSHRTFNAVKALVWLLVRDLRGTEFVPDPASLEDWEAYCRVAVAAYSLLFEHFRLPGERFVGGGVDSVTVPWPSP